MAVWLVRAGSHGEYESKFISESRVYVTWAQHPQTLRRHHLTKRKDADPYQRSKRPDELGGNVPRAIEAGVKSHARLAWASSRA